MSIRRRIRYTRNSGKGNVSYWADRLKDEPAFILGNSPALNDVNLDDIKPFFSVGINRAFYKIDPTVLFWQDAVLWQKERRGIMETQALKVCRDRSDPQKRFYNFSLAKGCFKKTKDPGSLCGMGASGPIAFQFVYALGCNPIILLGMDCQKRDGNTDFYGKNSHHRPHTLGNCKKGLNWIKDNHPEVEIINCSKDNRVFDFTPFEDVVQRLTQEHAKDRQYWVSRLLTR